MKSQPNYAAPRPWCIMPVKIARPVRLFTRGEQITEGAMVAILATIGANAAQYVPIDTAALLNSQFRTIEQGPTGLVGRIGYTQAYAAALHERMDWKPKPPGTPGKPNGGYNPDAQPGYLARGVEESREQIKKILRQYYGSI